MSNKTLENLVRQSTPTDVPLELWRQRNRGTRTTRPSATALMRRATLDVPIQPL